jgi:hypothetical protein
MFPETDPTRQGQIVIALREAEIAAGTLTTFKAALESWKPQNDAGRQARFHFLVRNKSSVARDDLIKEMNAAIQQHDEQHVVDITKIVWSVFSGGNPLWRNPRFAAGLPGSPFSSPTTLTPRPRVRAVEAREIVQDYLPILKQALLSTAGAQITPLVLEIIYWTELPGSELDAALVKTVPEITNDNNTFLTVLTVVSKLSDDGRLFREVVEYLKRNEGYLTQMSSQLGGRRNEMANTINSLIQYGRKNSNTLRSDGQLAEKLVSLIMSYRGSSDGFAPAQLATYIATGNIFQGGRTVSLTDDRNRREIEQIQVDDKPMTRVPFTKTEVNMGDGTIIKLSNLAVDGQDPRDVNLGVEIVAELGDKTEILSFNGPEQFSLVFQEQKHVVDFGKVKVAFGLEMISQKLTLMMAIQN